MIQIFIQTFKNVFASSKQLKIKMLNKIKTQITINTHSEIIFGEVISHILLLLAFYLNKKTKNSKAYHTQIWLFYITKSYKQEPQQQQQQKTKKRRWKRRPNRIKQLKIISVKIATKIYFIKQIV